MTKSFRTKSSILLPYLEIDGRKIRLTFSECHSGVTTQQKCLLELKRKKMFLFCFWAVSSELKIVACLFMSNEIKTSI